mgnify:CR=1 FL=1
MNFTTWSRNWKSTSSNEESAEEILMFSTLESGLLTKSVDFTDSRICPIKIIWTPESRRHLVVESGILLFRILSPLEYNLKPQYLGSEVYKVKSRKMSRITFHWATEPFLGYRNFPLDEDWKYYFIYWGNLVKGFSIFFLDS